VRIAAIQLKMIAGTYRSCYHIRHWQHNSGACLLPGCQFFPGDVPHLFKACPFLAPTLNAATLKAIDSLLNFPFLRSFFSWKLTQAPIPYMQFLPDPSTDEEVMAFPSFYKVAIPLLFKAT